MLLVAVLFAATGIPLSADEIQSCADAATLQDLVAFGQQGCVLPGMDRVLSSWSFDAHFLVSGSMVPATAVSAELNPVHPPGDETPRLFNYLFQDSIPVPAGDTLVLSLAYNLSAGDTNTPIFFFFGFPGQVLGSHFSDTSDLCVGGKFTDDTCSGSFYERTFAFDNVGGLATGAVNHLMFNDSSANRSTITITGLGGLSAFEVAVAAGPPPVTTAEPRYSAMISLCFVAMAAKRANAGRSVLS